MLNHIVFFKFKAQHPEAAEKTRELLLEMAGRIPELKFLEVGLDVVHSERSYDLALVTRFDTLEDLKAYQINPVHVEVVNYINTVREAAVTVDYFS